MNTTTPPEDNWLQPAKPFPLALAVLLSAPIATAVVTVILAATVFNRLVFAEGVDPLATSLGLIREGLTYGALTGWPVTLTVGLIAHAFLLRRTHATVIWYIGVGAIAGAGAGLVRALPEASTTDAMALMSIAAIGLVIGTLSGLTFWMIRRPDRDAGKAAAQP